MKLKKRFNSIISMILINFGLSFSINGAYQNINIQKNLFEAIYMGNYVSGVTKICASDQRCLISLSQIYCAVDISKGNLLEKGSCTFKNHLGHFGAIYNKEAKILTQQLISYGSSFRENGAELKVSVRNAVCSGQKNSVGQFEKICQVQK